MKHGVQGVEGGRVGEEKKKGKNLPSQHVSKEKKKTTSDIKKHFCGSIFR